VFAHFGAEAFQATLARTKQCEELFVEFRKNRCSYSIDRHSEFGGFASQFEILVVLREGRSNYALFAGLGPHQCIFKTRDHATRTQHQGSPLSRTTRKSLTLDLADEVDVQLVAILSSTLHGFKARILLAQNVQHVVHIRLADFSLRALDRDALETGYLNFRIDLERSHVLEVFAFLEHLGLHGRRTGRIQLLGDDGFVKAALNQIAQRFLTSTVLIALTNNAHRHLAGTETRHFGTACSLLQALSHFTLDTLGRNANGQTTLKS